MVRDARVRRRHRQRCDVVRADHRRRVGQERVGLLVRAMHAECLRSLLDAAEVELRGHHGERGVHRLRGRVQDIDSRGRALVVGDLPRRTADVVARVALMERGLRERVMRRVDDFVERMSFLQPFEQVIRLVRRSGLEPLRAAVGIVGVVVDGRRPRRRCRRIVVGPVLHHRDHAARSDLGRHVGRAQVEVWAGRRDVAAECLLRHGLQVEVQGRVDLETATVEEQGACIRCGTEDRILLDDALHVVAEECRAVLLRGHAPVLHRRDLRLDLGRNRCVVRDLRDLAVRQHPVEHVVASLERERVAVLRSVRGTGRPVDAQVVRVVQDCDQRGGLLKVESFRRDTEVIRRRGLDSVDPSTEQCDVQVALQDLVLAVLLLEPDRVPHLLELAHRVDLGGVVVAGLVRRQLLLLNGRRRGHVDLFGLAALHENVLHVLLRDRRAALHVLVECSEKGAADGAGDVDAAMVVEPRILGRYRRILHDLGDVVPADLDTVLRVERGDRDLLAALRGIHRRRLCERLDLDVLGQTVEHSDGVVGCSAGECDGGRDGSCSEDSGHDAQCEEPYRCSGNAPTCTFRRLHGVMIRVEPLDGTLRAPVVAQVARLLSRLLSRLRGACRRVR